MQKALDKLNQELELTKLEMNAVVERNKHYQIEIRILKEQLLLRQNIVDLSYDINRLTRNPPNETKSSKPVQDRSVYDDYAEKKGGFTRKDREIEAYVDDLKIEKEIDSQAEKVLSSYQSKPRSKSADSQRRYSNPNRMEIVNAYDRLNRSYDTSQSNQRSIFEEFDKSKKAKVRSRSISPGRNSSSEAFGERDTIDILSDKSSNPSIVSDRTYSKPPLPIPRKVSSSNNQHSENLSHDETSEQKKILSSSIDSSKDSTTSSLGSTKDKYQKLKMMYDRIHQKK